MIDPEAFGATDNLAWLVTREAIPIVTISFKWLGEIRNSIADARLSSFQAFANHPIVGL